MARTPFSTALAAALLFASACDEDPNDCPDGQVLVEDACLSCGPAGGCTERGPACRETCDVCEDGHTEIACI